MDIAPVVSNHRLLFLNPQSGFNNLSRRIYPTANKG
jgi:hypothetical protein